MLNDDLDVKAKVAAIARRLEELETRGSHEVKVVNELPKQIIQCAICQSDEHLVTECPTIPAVREMFVEQANVIGYSKQPNNSPYSNTYNPGWRNHPNLSWKNNQDQYASQQQAPQQNNTIEQAIVNLSKMVGDFVGEQKNINTQMSQRVDHLESSFNKRMDGLHSNLTQKFDNVQQAVSRLTTQNSVQEKGKFPL